MIILLLLLLYNVPAATLPLNSYNISVSQQFRRENVTVEIRWNNQHYHGASHVTVTLIPQHDNIVMISINRRRASAQLTVDYNTRYNVSVTNTLCEESITKTVELHYGELTPHCRVIAMQ